MSDFHPLTVSRIRRLTPNAVAVSLQIPAAVAEHFEFIPGQYITIRHQGAGGELRRAYSISSHPKDRELTVGIKKVAGGSFSVFANEVLKEGDTLEVMPPQGRFVYNPEDVRGAVVAFAAGSGITPIMSIIRSFLQQPGDEPFVLVYGNRSAEETMFGEDIRALQEANPDRLHVYNIYSRSREEDGMFGRIERSTANFVLRNKHKDLDFTRYYLCGPQEMIEMLEATLKENGVPADRILHELFTEPEGEDTLAEDLDGKTRLQVTLDDQPYELVMDRKSVVLDAVLNAGIDAPYSCQGGVCSTCIARVREGSAQMAKNQILTDSEIQQGFILTCQAHPTSAVLKVDYDDV